MRLLTSLVVLAPSTLAFAAKLIISIPPSPPSLPNPATLPPSTHAVLLGPPGVRYDAPIRRDSTLVFTELPEASYLLTIHSRDHFFPPFRVDVTKADDGSADGRLEMWQTFRGNEWSNKGPSFGAADGELNTEVRPSGMKDFYQQRGGFDIMSFFKSPMILMGLVSVVMIFGMPYLMENMDPETKKEFEEMQAKSPLMGQQGAANQIQNFDLAGFLAGSGGGGGKKK